MDSYIERRPFDSSAIGIVVVLVIVALILAGFSGLLQLTKVQIKTGSQTVQVE